MVGYNHLVLPDFGIQKQLRVTSMIALGFALLGLLSVDCARSQRTLIESIEGDHSRPLPFSLASLEARRDGARVRAGVAFNGPGPSDQLVLTLDLDLGPPIHLAGGDFRISQSGKMQTGIVNADTLDFQAGQSGGMSLGGRFRLLSHSGEMLYRVVLSPTAVQIPYR